MSALILPRRVTLRKDYAGTKIFFDRDHIATLLPTGTLHIRHTLLRPEQAPALLAAWELLRDAKPT